jgi:mono/diheme cytochrome c family protein
MKRFTLILTLAAGVIVLIAALGTAYAQDGHGEGAEAEDEFAAIRGAAVYAEFCQACHGPHGEAIGTGAAFGAITGDVEAARDVIDKGRDSDEANGAAMPPYGKILEVDQVDDLLAYLETWESGEVPPLPEPNIHGVPDQVPDYFGDPHAGAVVYAKFCNGCHGPAGEGRKKPDFPSFEFTGQTAAFVRDEHVPAFGESAGGPLSDTQIAEASDEPESEGVNVLIVVIGALAIVAIGGAYLSRIVTTERA